MAVAREAVGARLGQNPKQVQGWLGHHAASFTLDTYIALLADDIGEAPDFDALLADGATKGQHNAPKEAETLVPLAAAEGA